MPSAEWGVIFCFLRPPSENFMLSPPLSPPHLHELAHNKRQVKLEEVEVKSGEEEEEIVHDVRSKCFIFGETLLDKGTGNKTWRERGIGQAHILRHREHGRLRILMRQEKTMKVIINHAIDPRISLEPNAGSDRSWVWSAFDFAEGELVETVFALRFADSDIAGSFKDGFLQAQEEMEKVLAGEDAADTGAGDEAAEALAGLTTGEKEGDKEGGEVEEAAEAEAEAKEE